MRVGCWSAGLDEEGVRFLPRFEIAAVQIATETSVLAPLPIQSIENSRGAIQRRDRFARTSIEVAVKAVKVCVRLVMSFDEVFSFFSVLEVVANHVELFVKRTVQRDHSFAWNAIAIGI